MDQNERRVIDELFGKLRQVESQAPQREPEAEAHIRQLVAAQPAAPYYMAQAMLVQEQALASLQQRTQELERQLAARPASGGGGFLSGLFGGGQSQPAPQPRHGGMFPPQQQPHHGGPAAMGYGGAPWGGAPMGGGAWGGRPGGGGGGFLASAMTTAVGVAGGLLVADALSSAFSGGEEAVAGLAEGAGNVADEATAPFEDPGAQDAAAPEEFDAGGGFDEEAI